MEKFKLKINEDYAKRFQKQKQKAELDRLKQKYGDTNLENDSSSDETEDEDAKELTSKVEHDFLRTLSLIKQKDPRIYDNSSNFFNKDDEESKSENKSEEESNKTKKPVFLKDYERERLLTKGSLAFVSDDDSSDEEKTVQNHSRTYVEEQKELKESFKNIVHDDEEEGDDFLQVREKTKEEKDKEDEDYIRWLKGETGKSKSGEANELGTLRQYWNNPSLTDDEKFLRDFFLDKRYLDNDNERIPTYDEIVGGFEEEDDEEFQKQEEFERKYNFRYEEPDSEFIKTYPRTVAGSVRRKDDKRSKKRKETEERKMKEKEKKQEEIKRLKNLKKKEIMEKLNKLKEITGNPNVGFQEDELEDDFDPKKYDEMMQRVFDDEFYNEEEEEKPQFDNDEEIFGEENWDDWTRPEDVNNEEQVDYDDYEDDGNFNMDADFEPGGANWTEEMERKKNKKSSKFAKVIQKKKPLFNPSEKTFEEYFDEYYKLDYEDIIGDLPCRFKYRNVTPNDYGLTTEEIIFCPDKELNQWVSVRKSSQYRTEDEEKNDLQKFQKKAKDLKYKKRILSSLEELEKMKKEAEESENPSEEPRFKKDKSSLRNLHFHRRSAIRSRFGKRTLHPKIAEIREQSKRNRVERFFRGAKQKKLEKLSSNRLSAYRLIDRKKFNK